MAIGCRSVHGDWSSGRRDTCIERKLGRPTRVFRLRDPFFHMLKGPQVMRLIIWWRVFMLAGWLVLDFSRR